MENIPKKRKIEDDIERVANLLDDAPKDIKISDFVQARSLEMEAMLRVSGRTWGATNASQQLPPHMRRRAASHDIRRLPRRLKQQALYQREKGAEPKVNKRPSRRHRRRPKNLLSEYTRRQSKKGWLETHIWHAKRFHMVERWGWKIPLHPNDKGVRASYRAYSQFCLLQDLSYFTCVAFEGKASFILDGMQTMCSKDIGPSFAAVGCLLGKTEGKLVLYRSNQYPCGVIGPARFMWNAEDVNSETRQLWLWLHPSILSTVLDEVKVIFHIPNEENSGSNSTLPMPCKQEAATITDEPGTATQKTTEKAQDPRTVVVNPQVFETDDIRITIMKYDFCRLKLQGPLASAILSDALTPANVTSNDKINEGSSTNGNCLNIQEKDKSDEIDKAELNNNSESSEAWWKKYYKSQFQKDVYEKQCSVVKRIAETQTSDDIPGGTIIGLTVRDPRLLMPDKKLQIGLARKKYELVNDIPPEANHSPLWKTEVRQELKATKMSDFELNRKRSENLVPGSRTELGDDESRIPVIAIQQPGHTGTLGNTSVSDPKLGFGSGWDLIVPSGWGMPFWMALVYRGARAGGLREYRSMSTEANNLHFPEDYPDTEACRELQEVKSKEKIEKYNRMPPSKRCNYVKLGISAPYSFPWALLVHEWTNKNENLGTRSGPIVVLRDRNKLNELARLFTYHSKRKIPNMKDYDLDENVPNRIRNSLIAVHLNYVQRGSADTNAVICIPSSEDLEQFSLNKQFRPEEVKHKDSFKKDMKDKLKCQKIKGSKHVRNFDVKMLKDSCSREVLGLVTNGGFMFSKGNGAAVGFVVLEGLLKLYQSNYSQHKLVLVRNPSSFKYCFATLGILKHE